MGKMRLPALVVLLAAGLAFAAQMPQGVQTQKAHSGTMVLADARGMTLYTYDKDEPGKSNCNGLCAHFWPPLRASFQTVGLQRQAALYLWQGQEARRNERRRLREGVAPGNTISWPNLAKTIL
jgi:predicted lipoprotein with Yx(FWY)xxD motif